VQHGSFVALSWQEVPTGDIDRGVKPPSPREECNEEREHGQSSRSCEPHRCLSWWQTCYGPMEASGHQSFMEEVSILSISIFFIFVYLYSIMYMYFNVLLYDVLQLLRPYNIPSMLIDASVSISITDVEIEATCSFGFLHT
jgi:hypothetical protein